MGNKTCRKKQGLHPIDVGEQVIVLAPSDDLSQGVILPALYKGNAPSSSADIYTTHYKDGSTVPFDRSSETFSSCLKKDLKTIYEELFLCTSGFTLAVLKKFVEKSTKLSLHNTLYNVLDFSRNIIREVLKKTSLFSVPKICLNSSIPVEWVEINGKYCCDSLINIFYKHGVSFLPGTYFYWNDMNLGKKYFRISLMKKRETILGAKNIMEKALR